MATVCDVEPCKDMARAIDQLVSAGTEHSFFEIPVVHKKSMVVSVRLVYCPFCGTRIDEKWVEEARTPRRIIR